MVNSKICQNNGVMVQGSWFQWGYAEYTQRRNNKTENLTKRPLIRSSPCPVVCVFTDVVYEQMYVWTILAASVCV